MGKKTVTAVVQEDGNSILLKNPNQGVQIKYSLVELGIDPTGRSYGERFVTYWEKKNENQTEYQFITAMEQKRASRIENLYYAVMGAGYIAILVIGLCVFFVRRRIYTGWFLPFYYRLEKFYSKYEVWKDYNIEGEYELVDAVITYANENPDDFVQKFANVYLTPEEKKKKRSQLLISIGTGILIMAAILLAISLWVTVNSAVENRKSQARTAKVCEELQGAIDGNVEPLGEASDYYNLADMVERAKESFPGEDIYYKLQTTEDYVTLVITTEKKTNVYFDRYVPVDGNVGGEGVSYKLEISMVSDAIQPDDVLHNYTGILKADFR